MNHDGSSIFVAGPSSSLVRAAVEAVVRTARIPADTRVVGILSATGDPVVVSHSEGPPAVTNEGLAPLRLGPLSSPLGSTLSDGPLNSSWGGSDWDTGPVAASLFDGGSSWGDETSAPQLADGEWKPMGGADWGDVDLPVEEGAGQIATPAPEAARRNEATGAKEQTVRRDTDSRPKPKTDLSGVPPAIVDAARLLRRFIDNKVPKGVLLRVIKARVKSAGDIQTGLKDLCTLVKEYGTSTPNVMDAYRMVDHALPRVRKKQAHQVLAAIFDVE